MYLYPNKICWFYICTQIKFVDFIFSTWQVSLGFITSRKLQYIRQMSRRITKSEMERLHFLNFFFYLYQLYRIGTKSAFEFHNYRSVQISVILSNLKIKKQHMKLLYEHAYEQFPSIFFFFFIKFVFLFYKYLISILFSIFVFHN